MLLSVVIPVFNTKPYLEQLIASFQVQTVQNFELVVVDDASTDGSLAWLRENAASMPGLRFFPRPHGGLSATRNFGIAQCRGEVVSLVDSDDWVSSDFVEETLNPFRRTNCQWTIRPVNLVFEEGIFVNQTCYDGAITTTSEAGRFIQAGTVEERLRWWPSVWNKAFRREMIARNWFDEGACFEDHAFNIRNYGLESRFLFHPQPLYYHRRERLGQITAATGAINQQVFRCFDLWEQTIGNLAVADKASYLLSLAERLYYERADRFITQAEQTAFSNQYADWVRSKGMSSDPKLPR